MPSWTELVDEVKKAGTTYDLIRRDYLRRLHRRTGRNVIAYYSAWLQKGHLRQFGATGFEVNDLDKDGFMATIHRLDREKGLDLILHTPGGDIAATESLVAYLRDMFGTNVRAIVPQLAMSAGTMIALSCKQIVMGKHSSLGPIDPQVAGWAANAVIEEFERAAREVESDQSRIAIWAPIIAKYSPTLIGTCEKAIVWSKEVVHQWLETGMFEGDADAVQKASTVVDELGDHALQKTHDRHIGVDRAEELGLDIVRLEDDQGFQEDVLSVHHAFTLTLADNPVVKMIENHEGIAHSRTIEVVGRGTP